VFLAKNPTGLNEVFHLLVAETGDGRLDLLLLLNDRVYAGHDVSWIWDAEVEDWRRWSAPSSVDTRAISAAVRMKYAGVEEDRIALGDTVPEALALAVDRAAGKLFVVANYTAMTEVWEALAEQGRSC